MIDETEVVHGLDTPDVMVMAYDVKGVTFFPEWRTGGKDAVWVRIPDDTVRLAITSTDRGYSRFYVQDGKAKTLEQRYSSPGRTVSVWKVSPYDKGEPKRGYTPETDDEFAMLRIGSWVLAWGRTNPEPLCSSCGRDDQDCYINPLGFWVCLAGLPSRGQAPLHTRGPGGMSPGYHFMLDESGHIYGRLP